MNGITFFLSGRTTLFIAAAYIAVFVYHTAVSDAPSQEILSFVRNNFFAALVFISGCAHFGAKGVMLLRRKMQGAASGVILISAALLIFGLSLSAYFRTVERRMVRAGDVIAGGLKVLDIKMDLPDKILSMREEASVKIKNPSVRIEDRGNKTIQAYPFTRTSAGYMYINNAGVSPSLDAEAGGKRQHVNSLQLLPPGKTGVVQLLSDYSLEITLSPERELKKGRLTAYQYDLSKPQYRTVVKKGRTIVFDKVLRDRETVKIADQELRYGVVQKWVELVIVRDYAFLVVYVGLAGLCLGFLLLPLEIFYRLKG